MDYKNHLKTGAMTGILLMSAAYSDIKVEPAELVLYSAGIVVGSALPDIDHPNSYIAKKLSFLGAIISRVFSHRGFTHSVFFLALLEFIRRYGQQFFEGDSIGLFSYGMIGVIAASATHIFMDMFIGNGVKLFFPVIDKKIYISKIKSGSGAESIFIKVLTAVFCVALLYSEGHI